VNILSVGIDPGKSGGIALISDSRILAYPYSDDTLITCLQKARDWGDVRKVKVCVEKVGAMPGQGVVSMFNFGKSLGFIEGVLQAYAIAYQLVPPQTWKKEFSLVGDKSNSVDACRKLFPNINLLVTARTRKPHDGMAESLLMAEYARRRL